MQAIDSVYAGAVVVLILYRSLQTRQSSPAEKKLQHVFAAAPGGNCPRRWVLACIQRGEATEHADGVRHAEAETDAVSDDLRACSGSL